jgi:hypothetical protein
MFSANRGSFGKRNSTGCLNGKPKRGKRAKQRLPVTTPTEWAARLEAAKTMYTSNSSGDRVLTTNAHGAGLTDQIAAKREEFAKVQAGILTSPSLKIAVKTLEGIAKYFKNYTEAQVVETQTGLPAVQVVETQTGLETPAAQAAVHLRCGSKDEVKSNKPKPKHAPGLLREGPLHERGRCHPWFHPGPHHRLRHRCRSAVAVAIA